MSWEEQAGCGSARLPLFFGPDVEPEATRQLREARAKAVCRDCQVRAQCLESALRLAVRHGIWGGLTASERVRERRRRLRLQQLQLQEARPPDRSVPEPRYAMPDKRTS